MTNKAIDCLVNVHFGETEQQPNWMLKVRDDYFKGPESMFAPVDLAELLDEMDEQGVADAIAPRIERSRQRSSRRVCRCGSQLLGRWAVPAQRRRLLSAVHQMRRDGAAAVHQHRPAGTADSR